MIRSLPLVLLTLPTFSLMAQSLTGFPAAEAVSRETRPRADSFAGNGIDAGTGAFVAQEQLLVLQGVRSLGFAISYNSLLTQSAGVFGRGWSHEYEAYVDGDERGVVTVHWDANRKNRFRFVASGRPYEPLDEAVTYDELRREGSKWRLTLLDGTRYQFDNDGFLELISNRIGQEIEVGRLDGKVNVVREPSGKQIFLRYISGSNRLDYIEDNADRIVFFTYNNQGLLETVRSPVTMGLVQGGTFSRQNIPDGGTLTRTINVTTRGRIGLVRLVGTSISHPRLSDLRILLTSPSGKSVEMTTDQTNSLWNLDDAVLEFYDGEEQFGEWRLAVTDRRSGQTGTLNGWRMRFTEPTDAVTYRYNAMAQIVGAFDPNGRRLYSNTYDTQGRLIAQDDGRDDNQVAQVSYQETGSGVRTVYRDRAGAESVFEHDANYRLMATTNPLRAQTTYGYNPDGDRTSITDPLGRTTRLTFSPEGYPASLANPVGAVWTFEHAGGDLTSVRDPLGKRTEFEYQNHKVVRVKDAECLADTACAGVRKAYGGNGEMLSNILSDGGGIRYTWQNGRPVGASHPVSNRNEQATYDAVGRVTVSEDAAGFETRIEYNSSSQVISQTDPLGAVSTREYDRRGQVIRSTAPLGNSTTFAYDGNGNLAARTNSLGETTRYEYDGEDRLIRTINANGNATLTQYDAAGRVVREIDATGVSVRYEYDAADNVVATYDSGDVLIERVTYDNRDLPAARTDVYGRRSTAHYDDLARVIELVDPLGRSEILSYDRNDRLRSVRDRLRRTRTQSYDKDDVLLSITDSKNQSLEFEYDAANRVRTIRSPDGETTSIGYDSRDLVTFEDTGDVTHEYTYDDAGRLTEILRDHAETVQFELNRNAKVTAVRSRRQNETTARVRLRFEYDAVDRVQRFVDEAGNALRYTYNGSGGLESLTYPDGKQVKYSYDAAERLAGITDWAGRRTRYTYDNNGRLTRVELPNRVTQDFAYDRAGRLVRRTDRSGAGAVLDLRYSYDAVNQLANSQITPLPARFQPQTAQMTYGSDNRLTTFNGRNVAYNSRGAMISGPLGESFADFAYDLSGNLVRAGNTTYAYDEQDRLLRIEGPQGTSRFVVNPVSPLSHPVVRTGPDGSVTRYVWGPGLVYEERDGRIRTYHYDFTGSTVALADDSGAVAARVSYGPWGEIAARTGSTDTPFLYGGLFGVITDANGLVHMRYRWYSPQIKRFLSKDSEFGRLGTGSDSNRYAFAGSNPINFNDPNGRFLNALIGAVGGAIVNVAATTIVSFVTTGKPPTAGELAGAALEGALGGALLATCGPGCAVAASALIGGFSAAAGSVTAQLIDDGRVDPAQLGVDTGFGLAFGGLGGKVKVGGKGGRLFAKRGRGAVGTPQFGRQSLRPKAVSRRASNNLLQPPPVPAHITRPRSSVPKPALTFRLRVALGPPKAAAGRLLADVGSASAETLVQEWSEPFLLPSEEAGSATAGTRMSARASGRARVSAGLASTFGEFAHWDVYMMALSLAGRPEPDPAPALAVF